MQFVLAKTYLFKGKMDCVFSFHVGFQCFFFPRQKQVRKNSIVTFSIVRGMEKAVYQEKMMGQVRRESYKAPCMHEISLLEGW